MALAKVTVAAQNAFSPLMVLPLEKSVVIGVGTDHGNTANPAYQVWGSIDGVNATIGPLAMTDPTSGAGAFVTSLTGPDKAGVIQLNAPAFRAIALKRTDNNPNDAAAVWVNITAAV